MISRFFIVVLSIQLFGSSLNALNHPLSSDRLATILKISTIEAQTITDRLNKDDEAFTPALAAAYYDVMPNLIKKYNLKVGCELGTFFGRHAERILATTDITKLYCVDAFNHLHLGVWMNWPSHSYSEALYHKVKIILGQFKDRAVLYRKLSHEVAQFFKNNALDFIFIDAGHYYEAVKLDLESWFPKIRAGGILAGDDYDKFPGVIQAVNEFFGKHNITIHTEKNKRIWWVQKPKVIGGKK